MDATPPTFTRISRSLSGFLGSMVGKSDGGAEETQRSSLFREVKIYEEQSALIIHFRF